MFTEKPSEEDIQRWSQARSERLSAFIAGSDENALQWSLIERAVRGDGGLLQLGASDALRCMGSGAPLNPANEYLIGLLLSMLVNSAEAANMIAGLMAQNIEGKPRVGRPPATLKELELATAVLHQAATRATTITAAWEAVSDSENVSMETVKAAWSKWRDALYRIASDRSGLDYQDWIKHEMRERRGEG